MSGITRLTNLTGSANALCKIQIIRLSILMDLNRIVLRFIDNISFILIPLRPNYFSSKLMYPIRSKRANPSHQVGLLIVYFSICIFFLSIYGVPN